MSTFRIERKYPVTHETVELPTTAEAIARGQHLVEAVAHCAGCHGEGFGGGVMIDDFGLGRLVAPNLTSGKGGIGATYRVEDWVRAVRHGLDPQGHPLKIMPSETFQGFSRDDLAAIIAYMRSVPPVDRDLGETRLGPLARVLFVAGVLPLLPAEMIDHSASAKFAPASGETPAYGRYLAETAGCLHCHGDKLQGTKSPAPGFPDPPAIGQLAGRGWERADFVRALRSGKRPDGTELREPMPWQSLGRMTDEELHAIWLFMNEQRNEQQGLASRGASRG